MEQRQWVTFFSQTGGEICDLAERLGRWPDKIITNKRPADLRKIDSRLESKDLIYFSNKPAIEEYFKVLEDLDNPIITLHGWLRVMPAQVCYAYEIFNGHPGFITKYPELKGKDPQVRAFEGNYEFIGAVLHQVSPEVDEGRIIAEEFTAGGLSLDDTFRILKDRSLYMWHNFLEKML